MTELTFTLPANAPDLLEAAEVAHPTRSWPRVHAVVGLVTSWRTRDQPDTPARLETFQPPCDTEGREIRAFPVNFIGRAERRNREVPPHMTEGVRLVLRGATTREHLMTTDAARALGRELLAAADRLEGGA